MRKSVLFILIMVYLILHCSIVAAAGEDIPRPELVRLANEELIRRGILDYDYFNDKKNNAKKPLSTNPHLEGMRNLIVYGNPHGTFSQDRYRYLGYTMSDDPFTNYLFRNDATDNAPLIDRNWQKHPKDNSKTRDLPQIKNSRGRFNNNPDFEESIREGLKLISRIRNGQIYDFPEHRLDERQWYKYVHVYQPPTSVSWGSGIMFHMREDGSIWYQSIPMAPLEPDELPPPDTGSINASLRVVNVTPERLADGERGVRVTLDSSGSTAVLNDENVAITARRYFDDFGNEYPTTNNTFVFPVDYAQPGSFITLKVRVFSQDLYNAGLRAEDETSVTIHIGREREIEIDGRGVLAADARGSEKFDVLRGIPGTESLYANITDVPAYLADVEYRPVSDKVEYTVEVRRTYNLHWEVDNGHYRNIRDENGFIVRQEWIPNWVTRTDSQTITRTYTVEREYLYYLIDHLEVYGLENAVIRNGCLPNGSITLTPRGYAPPKVEIDRNNSNYFTNASTRKSALPDGATMRLRPDGQSSNVTVNKNSSRDYVIDPGYTIVIELPDVSLNGGRGGRPSTPYISQNEWRGIAEGAIWYVRVRNDKLVIDGHTVSDNRWRNGFTDEPAELPSAGSIGKDILFEHKGTVPNKELTINADTPNGVYESRGEINYIRIANINGSTERITNSIDVNPVIVHTPVECDPAVKDDRGFNQEADPVDNRSSVILGRPSTLTVPIVGKYMNLPGYNINYANYIREIQVRFPFDIYLGKDRNGTFLEAGTWHTIEGNQIDGSRNEVKLDFFLPEWVDEGNYDVEVKVFAVNSEYDDGRSQRRENSERRNNVPVNYVAENKVPIRVIGRVFGFKITDINDYPNWEEVFRKRTGSSEHTGRYYWVGNNNENGQKVRSDEKLTLPILNGSHTRIENLGVLKTGYKIRFDLTTIGNYYTENDFIRIRPRFYYVNKDGTGRREVDLWYMQRIDGKDSLVKVGSKQDEKNIKTMVLGEPNRNVSSKEIETTAEILGMSASELRNRETQIGYYSKIILHKPVRTFIGDTFIGGRENIPWGVDEEKVTKSVQKWYGEYNIPNTALVCEKGYDVLGEIGKRGTFTGKEDFWLKNGYIIVNFDIEVLRRIVPENGKDYDITRLSYWGSENCDMWEVEGSKGEKYDSNRVRFRLQSGDVIFYYTDERSTGDYGVR